MSSYIYELIRTEDIPVKCFSQEGGSVLVPAHWHNSVELLRVERGWLSVTLGEEKYRLERGRCLIVNSREIHSTFCGEDIALEVLQLPYPFLKRYIPDMDTRLFRREPEEEEAGHLLHRLNVLNRERGPGFLLQFHAALFELLCLLERSCSFTAGESAPGQDDRNRQRLIAVMDYVNRHYRDRITLEEAAALVALNKEYFCRFFKKNMGMSLIDYVNEVRFSHVCEELAVSDRSIMEALEEHGFTNYKLFRKLFYERYHCTPSAMRRKRQGRQSGEE